MSNSRQKIIEAERLISIVQMNEVCCIRQNAGKLEK